MRAFIRPLINWLNKYGLACVMIGHTRKKQNGKEMEAIDEIAGSCAWGTALWAPRRRWTDDQTLRR